MKKIYTIIFCFSLTSIAYNHVYAAQLDQARKVPKAKKRGAHVYKENSETLSSRVNKGKLKKMHAFNTYHVSCRSYKPKKWEGDEGLAGIVLYAYKGKFEWELNGVRCRSGYIILKKSDNIESIDSNEGRVHGKVYKSVFNEELDRKKVLGGGFAYYQGVWKFNSWTFNCPNSEADFYHDEKKCMNTDEEEIIKSALQYWMSTGNRNYELEKDMTIYGDTSYVNPDANYTTCIIL